MKNIDVKSLLIGALLTSTIFLGVAAVPAPKGTGLTPIGFPPIPAPAKWDKNQVWEVEDILYNEFRGNGQPRVRKPVYQGWEPYATYDPSAGKSKAGKKETLRLLIRRRIK